MSSATKTLELLSHFSLQRPEIGLSEMCRLAKRDKATTYRHLQVLEENGFVEQHPVNKLYRLGPALLQLAQTREATVPRKEGATPALQALAEATGETAHISVPSGTALYAFMAIESPQHSTRAIIDIPKLPLHATASGICAAAFGPAATMEAAQAAMHAFTPNTVSNMDDLEATVAETRNTGFGRAIGTYESDICSIAVPLFDQTAQFAGTVAVAGVATRFTPTLEQTVQTQLVTASREITRNWGGIIPQSVEQSWESTLLTSGNMERAS